jgi:hypothetical protein
MRFTLTYKGDLSPSGNKSKPTEASRIRNEFHDQLADLWDGHVILRQLARTARTYPDIQWLGTKNYPIPELPDWKGPIPPLEPGQTDYCAAINVPRVGNFIPLIRNSLHLACAIDILFLRHEEPLNLMKHGGDLDNRIKTLFDALKMPENQNQQQAEMTADPLYVVLEDDILVSDLSI